MTREEAIEVLAPHAPGIASILRRGGRRMNSDDILSMDVERVIAALMTLPAPSEEHRHDRG